VPSSIKLCRAVQVAVDGSNQIHRTRKLRAQRLYASRAVEQGEVAILAVAVVRWDGDGGDGFTPRPGLEVKREGDVLRILQRTQGGPSEKGLREVSREEDRLPTLCLVGPDPENGDQPRVRWFAPEE
jgi:hypothetical protein